MAGHSKWANIKHRKAAADAKKGKVFTRVSKELTIAARQGGGDPSANPRLRLAMQSARAANMANDKIQKAIQKGTGEIDGVNYEEYTYEGYAPCGVAIIVETVTDNKNRTVADVRHLFNKYGGSMGETNSVAWNFERKGVINISTANFSEDDMLEHVLESGAEDMSPTDGGYVVYTPLENFGQAQEYFEKLDGAEIGEAKTEFVANTMANIDSASDARRVMKFLEAFEDCDDVQNIYSNFEISDDVAAELEND